jgi:hypothetical protein
VVIKLFFLQKSLARLSLYMFFSNEDMSSLKIKNAS